MVRGPGRSREAGSDYIPKESLRLVDASATIATEISTRVWNPLALPPYLTIDGLKRSERRNIAVFRTQCAAYVATHAAHRDTDLFGDARSYGHRRLCWQAMCFAVDYVSQRPHNWATFGHSIVE